LRGSRQTELAAKHPIHVVCAWLGNTQAVAQTHYLQLRDSDFEDAIREVAAPQAAQKAAQQAAARGCTEAPAALATPPETRGLLGVAASCGSVQVWQMTPAGSEQPKDSRKKRGGSKKGGAKSGAPLANAPAVDSDLVRLAAAWADLPPAARAGIAAMAKSVGEATRHP